MDEPVKKRAKPRFASLPKLKGTKHPTIDREKLRQLYMDGPDPDFKAFCQLHNWNYELAKNIAPLAKWRLEWIEHKVAEQNAQAIPKAVVLRDFVLRKRLETVQEDVEMADAMANVHRGLMAVYTKIVQANVRAVQENPDIVKGLGLAEVRTSLKAGEVQVKKPYRPSISIPEWKMMTEAYAKIQEIRHRALFISQSKDQIEERMRLLKEQAIVDAENADQLSFVDREIEIKSLGEVKPAMLEEAICKWFDQASQAPTAEETIEAIIEGAPEDKNSDGPMGTENS